MGKLLVQKFGGSSLANAKRIEAVADIIAKTISEGNRVAVVLSAMGEETDKLIDLAKPLLKSGYGDYLMEIINE